MTNTFSDAFLIEELRNEYRKIRAKAVNYVGSFYSNQDFDDDVGVELRLYNLDQTPENWVKAAKEWCGHVVAEAALYEDYLIERQNDAMVGEQ